MLNDLNFKENLLNTYFISFMIWDGSIMAKRSKESVEKDELKVIKELQAHSKENIDNLAKKCGFSGPKLRRIIKNLEESQTIWGYSAVTDFEKLGMKEYLLLIKKTNKPLDETVEKIISHEFEKKAKDLDIFVSSSYYLHGIYDWVICFIATDLKQAKKFESHLDKEFAGTILETRILENIFPVKRSGIQNPSLKKLREYL
jgi:DNA-binding Lrp family transcriptional regulator